MGCKWGWLWKPFYGVQTHTPYYPSHCLSISMSPFMFPNFCHCMFCHLFCAGKTMPVLFYSSIITNIVCLGLEQLAFHWRRTLWISVSSQLPSCNAARGSSAELFFVGPTKVKACKSFLFPEGSLKVEIKNIWLCRGCRTMPSQKTRKIYSLVQVTFSRQCSNIIIFGITRLRLSLEWISIQFFLILDSVYSCYL